MTEVGALSVRLEATLARYEAQLKRAEAKTRETSRTIKGEADRMNRGLSEVGSRFGVDLSSRAAIAAGAIGGVALALRSVARAGDEIRSLEGRFRALTGSAERAGQLVEGVFGAALGTGAGLRDVGNLAAQFRLVTGELGASDAQVLEFTENLLKLGTIGGSSTQEMSNALRQLGQALAGGTLRAEEFNSVIEGAPMVAQALADELSGGSLGALRQMVLEGRVLSRDVFAAILRQTGEINDKFQLIPQNIERASNNLNTAMTGLLGQLDGALGFSERIAGAIQSAADALNQLRSWNAPGGGLEAGQRNLQRGALEEERQSLERAIAGRETRQARIGVSQEEAIGPLRQRLAAVNAELARLEAATEVTQGSALARGALPPGPPGRRAPAPGERPNIESIAPPSRGGGRSRPRDPFAGVIDGLRARDRTALEAQMEGSLAANPNLGEAERRQLSLTFRAVNELREGYRRLAEETGRPVQAVTPEQVAEIERYAFAIASAEEPTRRLQQAQEESRRSAEQQARALEALEDTLISGVANARSFADGLRSIGQALLASGLQGLLTGRGAFGGAFNDLLGVSAGGLGRLAGNALGFGAGPVLNARGNAFGGGRVIPFATGGIVSSPTTFPMQNAVGLMGEAGPEAILPLRRGPGGRLGVEASAGGVSVTNVYHFAPGVSPDQLRAEGERIKRETIASIAAARRENRAFLA